MEALEGASMQQDLGFPALLNASAKGTSLLHMGMALFRMGGISLCDIMRTYIR